MLYALLEEHDPGVERRLTEMHADRNFLQLEVRRALGTGEDRLWDGILITPRVRRVVKLAEEGTPLETEIEPGALLDAILVEGGGIAAELLRRSCGNLPGQTQVAG